MSIKQIWLSIVVMFGVSWLIFKFNPTLSGLLGAVAFLGAIIYIYPIFQKNKINKTEDVDQKEKLVQKHKKTMRNTAITWGILSCFFGSIILSSDDKFSTTAISGKIQTQLKESPWSDMTLQKATGANNYGAIVTSNGIERNISILEIATNYISVSFSVSGDLFNPESTYLQITNSFDTFKILYPEDKNSIDLLQSNLGSYIGEVLNSEYVQNDIPQFKSIEKQEGNIILTAGATYTDLIKKTAGSFYIGLSKNLKPVLDNETTQK